MKIYFCTTRRSLVNFLCTHPNVSKKANQFFLLLILIAGNFSLFAQAPVSTLSFTSIPSTTEIPSPGRGAEQWHSEASSQVIGNVTEGVTPVMLDAYVRSFLTWDNMEPSQGVYNWTNFDVAMNDAISKGRKLSFSIMALFPGYNGGVSANGVGMAYPLYLHNLMQSEGGNNTDWISPQNPSWVPNYNSPNWQARQAAFLNALAAHINTASSGGKNYRDALGVVSIGLMGSWAEWNFSNIVGNVATEFPAGRVPTFAAGKALIDAYINAFPNNPLVIPHAAFDRHQLQNVWTDPQTGWYALTASNKWGKIGITRMNWGLTEGYISAWAEDNVFTYNGLRFDTAIMNRYKYAPLTGEVAGYNAAVGGAPFWDLPRQVTFYHASSFGNGNYYGEQNISLQGRDNIRAAWRASGYRLVLETGTITSSLSGGMPFAVSLNWKNLGVAPAYENWNVTYELRNASNVAVWSGTSSFTPKFFLPSSTATTVTDNFTLPATIAQGNYSMVLIVRDPTGYRQPLPLAINGRNADGSYLLKSITVGTASNQPPVANAGAAQTITLPTNTVSLNGSGTDPDGTVSSYAWSKVSGPAGDAIQTPVAAVTVISGLVAGVYLYRLTVTDNAGASSTSDVTITVKSASTPPPPTNKPPIANAGADITITLPSNTTTLNGSGSSDPDGTIVTYGWSKLSGPAQFTIANATAASTGLSNLAQGVYTFKLQVTDNLGATGADTIKVTVNAAPTGNQAPVANAGPDITITLPVNTASLNGSASSDPDGTIAAYSWTKVSGPAQFSIASASAASTQVNNLVQGVYTFKLQVLDNSGATASDNVTVTVNAAGASNVAPIANAGPDVSLTLPSNTASLDGSASKDPDGSISKYSWNKLSGPGSVTISNSTSAVPSIGGLSAGQYVFELSVTDNKGATSKDQVNVVINQAAPVADAGNDTTVSLPATKISLKGHKSKDPNGAGITRYSWKQVSGPTASVLATPGVVTTEVSNLTVGEYVYELTVTNNAGISSSATVKVDVVNNFRYTEFFKLYPNPAAGSLNVEYISDVTGNMNAVIYDVKGSQIFNGQYTKNQSMLKKQIDVSKLKPGIYYLQVTQSDGTKFVRPFVKQ